MQSKTNATQKTNWMPTFEVIPFSTPNPVMTSPLLEVEVMWYSLELLSVHIDIMVGDEPWDLIISHDLVKEWADKDNVLATSIQPDGSGGEEMDLDSFLENQMDFAYALKLVKYVLRKNYNLNV